MSTNLLGPDLIKALHGEMVPKFQATLNGKAEPNVVPIISLDAADDHTLIFGEFLIHKTRTNLETNPHIAAIVLTEDLDIWTIRGKFRGFVDSGPYLDYLNQKEMFRYNAYVGIRRAAVIDVQEVTGSWKLSKLNVAAELLPVKLFSGQFGSKGHKAIPARVHEKFGRTQAIKVLAAKGKGDHPEVIPAFSLMPTKSQTMLFGTRLFRKQFSTLNKGSRVAASVITMDPVAYQAKGVFEGISLTPAGLLGRIQVDEIYSACPPLPGEPIGLTDHSP